MATELHLSNNPIHGIKRHLMELKESDCNQSQLLKSVIDSNARTQQAVAEVSRSINDFVALLKSVDDSGESKEQKPAVNNKAADIEQKLDKIAAQNLQLIQVISELVRHLKKEKGMPQQPQYTGIYPMRQIR